MAVYFVKVKKHKETFCICVCVVTNQKSIILSKNYKVPNLVSQGVRKEILRKRPAKHRNTCRKIIFFLIEYLHLAEKALTNDDLRKIILTAFCVVICR